MKSFIKTILLFILTSFFAIWILGSEEPAELKPTFDRKSIGNDIDDYLNKRENRFTDIIPGVKKRVIWSQGVPKKTPFSIIYIHGFTATSEELRPVPDRIASALQANLYYTRLAGHGRGSDAMAEPKVKDWMNDMAEALEIGRRIGNKIIVISTSTGSTITAAAMFNQVLSENVIGLVFISPNFGVNNPLARLLTWPGARLWIPLLGGKIRKNKPRNILHAKYWTTSYPTVATLPMAAIVKAVIRKDFRRIQLPALFYFSLDDKVVDPEATKGILGQWGGVKKTINVTMTKEDDQYSHIISGDAISPNQTRYTVEKILEWIKTLPGSK